MNVSCMKRQSSAGCRPEFLGKGGDSTGWDATPGLVHSDLVTPGVIPGTYADYRDSQRFCRQVVRALGRSWSVPVDPG